MVEPLCQRARRANQGEDRLTEKGYTLPFPVEDGCVAILSSSGTPEVFRLRVRRVATPLKIRYLKRPHNLAVTEYGKVQEVNAPAIRQKQGETSHMKDLAISLLSTESIEYRPTGQPSESYPLGVQSLPLPRLTHLSLRPNLPKSATLQPTGAQGESRSIRGIGVHPPVSRQSGIVGILGDHHAVLRPHSIPDTPFQSKVRRKSLGRSLYTNGSLSRARYTYNCTSSR